MWRSADNADKAAEALKLTAQDMERFKIIDEVIPEPVGGAHRNPEMAINAIGNVIENRLATLLSISKEEIIKQKEDKYLNIG